MPAAPQTQKLRRGFRQQIEPAFPLLPNAWFREPQHSSSRRKKCLTKSSVDNPEEKQMVFENTHEPILDAETWERPLPAEVSECQKKTGL